MVTDLVPRSVEIIASRKTLIFITHLLFLMSPQFLLLGGEVLNLLVKGLRLKQFQIKTVSD